MTEGSPFGLITRFSLPLLFANALQLFYIIADSAIIGRMLGITAFAAVGASTLLYWFVLQAVNGLVIGFGIVLAQRFGADDFDGFRRAFMTAVYLKLTFGLLAACAGIFGGRFFLTMLNTPSELMEGAVTYLAWLVGGVAVTALFFLMLAVLRALGDSKTPTQAMIFSALCNIVLAIALVRPLEIAGVAIATLLSQLIGGVYCFIVLRKTGILKGEGLNWDTASAKMLLRIGLPLSARNCAVQAGGLVVQRHVNYFGTEFIAGVSIARRMYSLIMLPLNSIDPGIATFVAQNFGAGKIDRVKQGVAVGQKMLLATSAMTMVFTLVFGRFLLALLFQGDPSQIYIVLDIGMRQLTVLTLALPILYMLFLYRTTLEALGRPFIPAVSGFVELAFRLGCIFMMPFIGVWGIFLVDPAGWVAAVVLLAAAYYYTMRQLKGA